MLSAFYRPTRQTSKVSKVMLKWPLKDVNVVKMSQCRHLSEGRQQQPSRQVGVRHRAPCSLPNHGQNSWSRLRCRTTTDNFNLNLNFNVEMIFFNFFHSFNVKMISLLTSTSNWPIVNPFLNNTQYQTRQNIKIAFVFPELLPQLSFAIKFISFVVCFYWGHALIISGFSRTYVP